MRLLRALVSTGSRCTTCSGVSLIRERADEANRLQKVLEGGNITLGSVVSDILGKSSRDILAGIVAGISTPEELAALARTRLRATPEELTEAQRGRLDAHQRMLLRMQLDHVRCLDQQIATLDTEVAKQLAPLTPNCGNWTPSLGSMSGPLRRSLPSSVPT